MTKEAEEQQGPAAGSGLAAGIAPEPAAAEPAPAAGAPELAAGSRAGGAVTPPPPAQPQPPMGVIDWIYGVLFRPRDTMERLAASERPPLALAAGVTVFATIANGLASATELSRLLEPGGDLSLGTGVGVPPAGLGPEAASVGGAFLTLLGVPMSLIFWFILAAMYHLAADLMGGRGDGRHLLAGLGLAMLPEAFVLPVNALAVRLPAGGDALTTVAGAASLLWWLYLTYRAVRATKRLTRWRALFIVLLPVLALVALLVLVLIAVFLSVFVAAGMA